MVYLPITHDTAHDFSQALIWLKGSRKISRRGWNGKGMFIYLVAGCDHEIGNSAETQPLESILGQGTNITYQARIDMKFASGQIGIWTPTHEDILAKDWNVLV